MEHLLDELAITRLQARYGDAVTRRAWAELSDLFEPACPLRLDLHNGTPIEVQGATEIAAFLSRSVERFDLFLFTVLNTVVDVGADGTTAIGRLYIREFRQERDGNRWTTAFGLYRDRYAKRDGRWMFAERSYTSLARTASEGDGMDVFELPA